MNTSALRTPYRLYLRLATWPMGRWLFSRLICLRAPYFASISPLFRDLRPGRAEVSMRKRRRVQNHIGTVHALAMGNLCEIAAGLVMEATLPGNMRWIPRGMNIEYMHKAETDLVATALLPERGWGKAEDVPVEVTVRDTEDQAVVRAVISIYVSPAR